MGPAMQQPLPADTVPAMQPVVRITRDVVYGHARVQCRDGAEGISRPLKLDVYAPAGTGDTSDMGDTGDGKAQPPRPVVVLAFGGAFHRGSKEVDAFGAPDERNTSVADYCHMLAEQGYVACSIDYRLVQEDPDPGHTPVVAEPASIPRSRVDVVRAMLGLPPADDLMLWRGIEAASDDMAMAARFVAAQANAWNIDPARMALGGFSAGARTALNAVYGEKVAAAAVVSLSGYVDAGDLQRHLRGHAGAPPTLLVSAENDLDYIAKHTPAMLRSLRASGVRCEHVLVSGAGHFYPHGAAAVHDSDGATTVGSAVAKFLQQVLRSGEPQ